MSKRSTAKGEMTRSGPAKAVRWIVCSCAVLILTAATSSADVCVLKVASVSHVRGQAKAFDDFLDGVPVQLWKSDPKGLKLSLIAEGTTDISGYFSFSNIPSGWYRLAFPVPGFDGDDFLIHLQGRGLFRWFPRNWLQIGLGITSLHCPETYMETARKKQSAVTP
jgi:hypothetical protein